MLAHLGIGRAHVVGHSSSGMMALQLALDARGGRHAGAAGVFAQERPAVQAWSFTPEYAARVTLPVLAVVGPDSVATFAERRELLASWLPDVELVDLRDATHRLHVDQPGTLAGGLADFIARHPPGR